MTEQDILDAAGSGETLDWEFKSAKGGFPAFVWETYSAMANTEGGTVVLGVGEKDGRYTAEGLSQPEKTLKECFDSANNRGKVSLNLLGTDGALLIDIAGKIVLAMRIPRAGRRQRRCLSGRTRSTAPSAEATKGITTARGKKSGGCLPTSRWSLPIPASCLISR